MNRSPSLAALLNNLAQRQHRRIGIGVQAPTDAMIEGFRQARAFCTPVLYGTACPEFDCFSSARPEELLISDLGRGRIDGAVRGQIHALPFRTELSRRYGPSFRPTEQQIAVLEFPGGRPMVMAPANNPVAGDMEERAALIEASAAFCARLGLPVRIGLLARCRPDDVSAWSEDTEEIRRINACHYETEMLVGRYRDRFAIRNYGIDFEKAYEDGVTVLIEPNGTVGNQVIRTLYFLNVIRFYGAPLMNAGDVVLESFKNSGELADVMLLAAAMANARSDPPGGMSP